MSSEIHHVHLAFQDRVKVKVKNVKKKLVRDGPTFQDRLLPRGVSYIYAFIYNTRIGHIANPK